MNRADYVLFGAKATAAKGNDLPQAKLNPDIVAAILVNRHGESTKKWAAKLGVHYRTIEKIQYRETWRHVK